MKFYPLQTISRCLLAGLVMLLTVAQVNAREANVQTSEPIAKPSASRTIGWDELMPPVDEAVVARYKSGAMTMEDVEDYMERLGQTAVQQLDAVKVRLPGYLVPLNIDAKQMATELLLVPSAGACIHVPPPPPNQTVFVRMAEGIKVTEAGYTPYWIEGVMTVNRNETKYTDSLYEIKVTKLEEYYLEPDPLLDADPATGG
ncbi:DUF3299 domain-containing protein [Spongorhabdus nitratireducens]